LHPYIFQLNQIPTALHISSLKFLNRSTNNWYY